ncbi:MAG: tetratricopeptide repeat protein [Acidobacteria bacterium]|nr:tetratricopeptide repeat protein [Acidobacteriota bacterium]
MELERRVRKDPASPLFGRLADEYRLAGRHADAIEVCRAGLALRPDYHSARVTLARALMQLGHYTKARDEFERVLRSAPDNLAALRGLEEIADTHAGWAHPASSSPPAHAASAVPAGEISPAVLAVPDAGREPRPDAADAGGPGHVVNAAGAADVADDAAIVVDTAGVGAAADVVDLADVPGLVDVADVADMAGAGDGVGVGDVADRADIADTADISGMDDAVGVAEIGLTFGLETADATDADEEAMLQARRGAVAALIGLEHFLSLVIARREALEAAPPGR